VADLIRQVGISEQTYCRWKKQYAGLQSNQVQELKQLQDENARLGETGATRETIAAVLWHSNQSITDHYSVAMVREIYEALEKIKDEGGSWNKSLQTLIFEARARNVPKVSPAKRTTG
jgi:hypothetical protein